MGEMANDDVKPEVLTSLPRTRPQRRSAKRDAPKPRAKASTTKPRAAAKPTAAAKPRAAAKPKATAKSRPIPPAGFATPADRGDRPAPGGVELIGTAIQAAGELAQIGLAIGGQALRSALGRGRE